MFRAILAMFLHVSVNPILGDVFVDIETVFFDIFPRFLEHHKKHEFLIVFRLLWPLPTALNFSCGRCMWTWIVSSCLSLHLTHIVWFHFVILFWESCPIRSKMALINWMIVSGEVTKMKWLLVWFPAVKSSLSLTKTLPRGRMPEMLHKKKVIWSLWPHKILVYVLMATTHHTTLKYTCPIKLNNKTRHIHIMASM